MARLHFGSDHGGIELREELAAWSREQGHEVLSVRGPQPGESVDYPDIGAELCRVLLSEDDAALGILICGTGQGMAITANKIAGIRAGVASDVFSAAMLREHNDARVLCMGQRVLGVELAREILSRFLGAEFGGGRHQRRVDKINALDPS